MPLKIISAGQTGIDRMAREVALELGLETGGGHVSDADATVLYGDPESPAAKAIFEYCLNENKPYLLNPIPDDLTAFIRDNRIQVLNAAGDRGSKIEPEFLDAYRTAFRQALLPFSEINN
jgi:hypothetical protein